MTPPKTRRPSPDALRGSVLSPNAAIEQEYTAVILTLVRKMCDDTKKALQAVFAGEKPIIEPAAMDAADTGTSTQARIALNALMDKYDPLFNRWAKKSTKRMMDRTVKNSGITLGMSLRQMSAAVQLDASKITPELLEIINASTTEAVSLIKLIPAKYLTNVQGAVSRSITSGNGMADLVPFLDKQYQGNVRHARNVAADQVRKAYSNTTATRMSGIGVKTYEWIHTGGPKEPRALHIALNGTVCSLDEPPYIGEMYGQPVYGKPGDLPNCLPAWSNVESTAGLNKLYRRVYHGPLSQIVTDSGALLEATANHPILTARGWLPAHLVKVGDYVVKAHQHGDRSLKGQVARPVVTVGELFDAAALAVGPGVRLPGGSALEFHGDVSDGEVDVVFVDGYLPREFDAKACEGLIEFLLAWASERSDLVTAEIDRAPHELVMRVLHAPDRIVSGLSPLLALFRSHAAHADDVRRRLAADLTASLNQSPAHDIARHAELIRNLQLAHAAHVEGHDLRIREILSACGRAFDFGDGVAPTADELGERIGVEFHRRGSLLKTSSGIENFERVTQHSVIQDFSGHVYNLESGRGWYSTNGLIVHNCRCRMRPILNFSDD
jgi:hypothetical protein